MANKTNDGKKIMRSNTKAAKSVIRNEIRGYYSPSTIGEGRSALENMKKEANSFNCGRQGRYSDYQKGAALVQAGNFAIMYNDQRKVLSKIYGKKNIESWNNDKVHNTYKHLIGREYAAMLNERERDRIKKARAAAKKAAKTPAKKTTKKR